MIEQVIQFSHIRGKGTVSGQGMAELERALINMKQSIQRLQQIAPAKDEADQTNQMINNLCAAIGVYIPDNS